ncbi:glycosyltransferase [Paenibacillus sp. FSL K6-3182]|uniref:glycosyltransferase n=1 Tax=Paenibacillus sp. FSL K6-3182 TaxID=2921495 RepID=UPI0030CB970E
MKKKLLFIMNNLNCGGAEKSLLSLLQTIDYSKYDVDLYLFKHEGIFLSKLPMQVNLLKEPPYYQYFDMPLKAALIDCIAKGRFSVAMFRLFAGYIFYTEKNASRREQRVWKYLSYTLPSLSGTYDAAIGYLEKNPVYFGIEKVKATKKLGYIHNDYNKLQMDPNIDNKFFEFLDHLVTVSDICGEVLEQKFPQYKSKVRVIQNIVSPTLIHQMSVESSNLYDNKSTTIVSIGRLNKQKGFEMAIEACKSLVDKNYDIRWYVIGEGEERNRLEQMINDYQLHDHFYLIGIKDNPYPYIREADIYVQPSRFEGKSIAIDEAKILNKPIVVTNFSTAKDQITHYENGLIVEMNSAAISEGIIEIMESDALRLSLKECLSKESLGTESEIEKFYALT